ncbi:MAG TPA: MFS transporter [Firmicutes bacterium]|nr:MFS transporter [Bacillota bacterium]
MFFTYTWYRLLPLILRDMNATDNQISMAYALITLAQALFQYPGGLLADRWGRKQMICAPGIVFGTAYLLAAITSSWQVVVACMVLIQACNALQAPSFTAIITESADPRQKGLALGIYQTSVAAALALGPAVGAFFSGIAATRQLMAVTGVASFLVSAWRWLSLSETGKFSRDLSLKVDWKAVLSILPIGIPFAFLAPLTVNGPFIQLYGKDVLNFSENEVNLLFVGGPLLSVFVMVVGGRMVDVNGAFHTLILTCLAYAASMMLWTRVYSLLPNGLLFGLAYLFLQVATISYDALRAGLATDESRGSVLGLTGTISGILAALGPPVASRLSHRMGRTVPFWLALVFALLAVFSTIRKAGRKGVVLREN